MQSSSAIRAAGMAGLPASQMCTKAMAKRAAVVPGLGSDNSSCAGGHAGTFLTVADGSLTGLVPWTNASCDGIAEPACSHLHVGAKRTRTLAFSGDAASTQTDPSLPCQSLRLISLSARIMDESIEHGAYIWQDSHQQGQRQPSQCTEDGASMGLTQRCQEVSLRAVAGSTTRGDVVNVNTGEGPRTTAAVPAGHSSMSITGSLDAGGRDQLSAILSASSPAILQKLLAATKPAAAPGVSLGHADAGCETATICSTEPTLNAKQMRSSSERTARAGTGARAVVSDSFRSRLGGPADVVGLSPDARADAPDVGHDVEAADGGGSGSASDSAGDAVLDGEGVDGRASGRKGPDGGKDGASAKAKPARSAPNGTAGMAGGSKASSAWAEPAATAPPIGAPACAIPPSHHSRSQPTGPVSTQLGAALPPELAARLKKRIRIIQPISRAWVEETLQCASGATAHCPGSNGGPAAAPAAADSTDAHQTRSSAVLPPCSPREAKPGGTPPVATAVNVVTFAAALRSAGGDGKMAMNSASRPASGATAPALEPGAWPSAATAAAAGGLHARKSLSGAAAAASERCGGPCEPAMQGMTGRALKASIAALAPTQLAAATPSAGAPEPVAAAADDTLPKLIGRPGAESVSHLDASCLEAPPPLQGGSGLPCTCGAALPPGNGSQTSSLLSAMPDTAAVGVSPFSSDNLPQRLGSGTFPPRSTSGTVTSDWGLAPAPAACSAEAAAMAPAAAFGPGGCGLNALAALLVGAAPLHTPTPGASRRAPEALQSGGVGAWCAAGPSALLPLLQAPSSTATTTTSSASCLGKVQGELTLLYQWYVANKAVYLDQAQRQLQRIEALTAAREGTDGGKSGGADAVAAACARAESAEAMRAFETALKIMSVCGGVEQQWLSPAPAARPPPLAGGAVAAAAAGLCPLAAAPPPGAVTPADLGLDGLTPPEPAAQAHGPPLLGNVPAPSRGLAHGPSAALAVASALVGYVARGQCTVPTAPAAPPLACSGESERVNGVGMKPAPLVRTSSVAAANAVPCAIAGLPLQGLAQALPVATAAAAAAAPPPLLPLRSASMSLSPPVAQRSQTTAA